MVKGTANPARREPTNTSALNPQETAVPQPLAVAHDDQPAAAATPPAPYPLTCLTPARERRRRISTPGSRQAGQQQQWERESLDGRWLYVRTEEPGTPWRIFRLTNGKPGEHSVPASSLRQARLFTATGVADYELAQRAAAAAAPRCSWRSPWGTGSTCSRPAEPDGFCDLPVHGPEVTW